MKSTIAVIVLLTLCPAVFAGGLKRSDRFESPTAFSETLQAFVPASDQGEIGSLFSAKEYVQQGAPQTGAHTWAKGIDFCEVLDANDESEWALVWAKSKVPTDGNDSAVAAVFLLKREKDGWHISDLRRFEAHGQYAKVAVKMTSGRPLAFTVSEEQGGRLYCYEVCGSFECAGGKIKQLELE